MRELLNLISIYRYYRKPELITNPNYTLSKLFEIGKSCKQNSFKYKLNLALIKKIRATYPYRVFDYSKNKEKYENYFKTENHIPSYEKFIELLNTKKEIFITKFNDEVPYRGNRYCEYFSDFTFLNNKVVIYKAKVENIKDHYIILKNVSDGSNHYDFNCKNFTTYLFSTDEEINKFKTAENLLIEVDAKIKDTEKELSNLYGIKNSIIKLNFD